MKKNLVTVVLFAAVLLAAFALVKTRFAARAHYARLAQLQSENAELRQRRRQLLIEHSTFSDLPAAHRAASEALEMRHPSLADGTLIYLGAGGENG
jgi:cell division protein FtsL